MATSRPVIDDLLAGYNCSIFTCVRALCALQMHRVLNPSAASGMARLGVAKPSQSKAMRRYPPVLCPPVFTDVL